MMRVQKQKLSLMNRFSDFSEEKTQLEGDKISIDEVLNREIVVNDFRIAKSKYPKNKSGDYLTLQIEINELKKVIFTGSDVLISQCKRYSDKMPFLAEIKKVNRYYTFT